MSKRIPAEVWPVGDYLAEEMAARNWTSRDVALRMGGANLREVAIDQCCVDLTLYVHDKNLRLGDEFARKLGRAFDVSPDLFLNLERTWLETP